MTNPNQIDLTQAIATAAEQAKVAAEQSITRAANSIIAGMFNDGRYGRPEGAAHMILRQRLDEYVLSDAFAKLVDEALVEHAPKAASEAVLTLLKSKTRKHLFTAGDKD